MVPAKALGKGIVWRLAGKRHFALQGQSTNGDSMGVAVFVWGLFTLPDVSEADAWLPIQTDRAVVISKGSE